ncbi:uncharacterized protein OGAPODRAFT_9954 [Ogataea polymorpha]|uniref:uncharacterized protein n=1 Tax=Ogataea polymorpha TaxID=460523 RepID=UPI0007F34EC0|nr:uncharacterized protein OGAPODRAFT_9954 [Ogataea polymorpha]OBA14447.1 hypothetical protein OGAPODRAFT_9954 [Ogataea polymorpha]
MFDDEQGMKIAYEEALKGYEEGGIPIGSCLVHEDGTVLGRGHNMRIQKGSPTLHGEISCLENCGRLKAEVYAKCTLYTTLSPCSMCSGSALLFKIPRLVMGENVNFQGAEDWLQKNGVEVINLKNEKCEKLMAKFIEERPGDWYEDIGESEK